MVNWTAEKYEILLKGIFKFHDIKSSQKLTEYLANQIGNGCTPKAVSHQLSHLRKGTKPVSGRNTLSTPRKTTSVAKPTRTPVSGRARASVKKTIELEPEDSDEELDEDLLLSPSVKRQRTRTPSMKRSYAESSAASGDDEDEEEFVPQRKKVKVERVEEEDIDGVEFEEDDEGVSFV